MYDKKIAYLHYVKGKELAGNVGHVKITLRGGSASMEVYIRDAYGILNGCYYIQNLGGSPFEDKLYIEGGQAVYKKRIEIKKNDRDAMPYGIKIEINKEEHLEAVWQAKGQEEQRDRQWDKLEEEKEAERTTNWQEQPDGAAWSDSWPDGKEQETEQEGERKEEGTWETRKTGEERMGSTESQSWTGWTDFGNKVPEDGENAAAVGDADGERVPWRGRERETIGREDRRKAGERQRFADMRVAENGLAGQEGTWKKLTFSVPVETYEDKWDELCKKYEVVHPFGNREEYLSLSPKDFIIFPEKYQHLVNNSFLLHGYYNYRHVILGKKEEGGKNIYYLGVPGVYYEREKMVAIMFGFEGFECGEKRAIAGGFGYYMRRVEL